MPRKKTSPEKIISLLWQIEVQMVSGATLLQACKQAQISAQATTAGGRSSAACKSTKPNDSKRSSERTTA